MKHQAPRILALMLSVLLAAAAPARAGTIHLADVMQAASEGRRGPWADLRLRAIQQQGGRTASGVVATTPAQKTDAATAAGNGAVAPDGSTAGNTPTSLISQDPPPQQGTVETIDLGDITGTVCDCGELPVLDTPGGFPLWPLAGLAGIPFLFIDRDGGPTPPNIVPPGPTPTTTTTPPPAVPEPATLLLFGSGLLALGAGARRRRGLKTLEVEARDQEVV